MPKVSKVVPGLNKISILYNKIFSDCELKEQWLKLILRKINRLLSFMVNCSGACKYTI